MALDSGIVSAIISAIVTIVGLISAYATWRRDMKIKLQKMREEVSAELISQRIEPYAEFMKHLEVFSSLHRNELETNTQKMAEVIDMLQDAIYGKIGLIASHQTRPLLLFVRLGCIQFTKSEITFEELIHRVWALHFSMRSDVGIIQPMWESEVERIQKQTGKGERSWERAWESVVKNYPWDKLDFRYKKPETLKIDPLALPTQKSLQKGKRVAK